MDLQDYGYRIVQIEVTNRCNMRCTFCPVPIREIPLRDMRKGEISGILEELAKWDGIENIAFHQFGEPLLYEGLWDCVEKARGLGLQTDVTTNGLLANRETAMKMIDTPPDFLVVSLNTITPEHYYATRGTKAPYEKYIDGITDFLSVIVDSDHDIRRINTLIAVNDTRWRGWRHWVKQKIGLVRAQDPTIYDPGPLKVRPHFVLFLEILEAKSERFQFSEEELDQRIDDYFNFRTRGRINIAYELAPNNHIVYKEFVHGRRLTQHYPVEKALCGTKILGILADGTVTACCVDYDGSTGLGNIFEGDLETILDRSRAILDGLRRTGELHFEVCKKCRGAPTWIGARIKEYRTKKSLGAT